VLHKEAEVAVFYVTIIVTAGNTFKKSLDNDIFLNGEEEVQKEEYQDRGGDGLRGYNLQRDDREYFRAGHLPGD